MGSKVLLAMAIVLPIGMQEHLADYFDYDIRGRADPLSPAITSGQRAWTVLCSPADDLPLPDIPQPAVFVPNASSSGHQVLRAEPIKESMPLPGRPAPRVLVHQASDEPRHKRLKTLATFPLPQERHLPREEQPLPIVLVHPSDGGQPILATPLVDDNKPKPKNRQPINLPELLEVETQPAPAAKRNAVRRRRSSSCA